RYVSAMDALDTFGRPLRDLRISVTDRCNFRCVYCMPKEVYGRDHRFLERRELLSFEEIARVARVFAEAGVKKIRITGGEPLAPFFRERGHTLRFIEYMDVGNTNGWRLDDVLPAREIVARLDEAFGVEPVDPDYRGEVAQRWRYRDGAGEFGVIASVTQPFCGDCTRARLSAEGKLFTCLFALRGHDLRALIRGGATDEELEAAIRGVWGGRADRYSDLRSAATADLDKVEMSYIGG